MLLALLQRSVFYGETEGTARRTVSDEQRAARVEAHDVRLQQNNSANQQHYHAAVSTPSTPKDSLSHSLRHMQSYA